MKYIIPTLALALSVSPLAAHAAFEKVNKENVYVSVAGEGTFFSETDIGVAGLSVPMEFDTGFGVSLAGGYEFGNGFRAEAEFAYRLNDVSFPTGGDISAELDSFSYMANGYYDFGSKGAGLIIPYVGAGIGMTDVEGEVFEMSYQAMAGLSTYISDTSEIYGGYRYFTTPDVSYRGISYDYDASIVEIGYRTRF
jgi:opacity protein-like surface antigen